ncbi:putative nonsense-mediated mRNA decay factor [Dipodascopsis tothii]|uniref:putative nonsense-mediated mRNA decay factor n=1 Tax=Dipodascopsis tothii TaxID=44089 RepID=UPI0034CF8568
MVENQLSLDETARRKRRDKLYKANSSAWEGERVIAAGSLDSSLKKNTAFIKRLRTSLNADNQGILLREIATLSLEKYMSELIGAASEGLLKCRVTSDIWAAIEVISALHQRFGSRFTATLTLQLLRGFVSPPQPNNAIATPAEQREKEDQSRLLKYRTLLRLLTEFWACGIIRTSQEARNLSEETVVIPTQIASVSSMSSLRKPPTTTNPGNCLKNSGLYSFEPIPLEILRELLSTDKDFLYLPIAVMFVKNFSFDILGVSLKKRDKEDNAVNNSETELKDLRFEVAKDAELQQKFRDILSEYNDKLQLHIKSQHDTIKAREKKNKTIYMRAGQVFENREADFDKFLKTQEKLIANAHVICEALGSDMIDLPHDSYESRDQMVLEGVSSTFNRDTPESYGIWEDEDEKRFYEDLVDVASRVSPDLQDSGKKAVNTEASSTQISETGLSDEDDDDEDDDEDNDGSLSNQSIGAQMDLILLRLPEMTNRESVDQVAIDFCLLNSRASRNRLAKCLRSIPKSRQDLIPFFGRLVASLSKVFSDIGAQVVAFLQRSFKRLIKKNNRESRELRTTTMQYISELTKFRVMPDHITFYCLRQLVEDFSHHNIECLCLLIEGCGRMLFRSESTRESMSHILDIVWRKMTAMHLDTQDRILLENAFFYVNKPDKQSFITKERSSYELYLRRLLYVDLSQPNCTKVLKQIRKFNWSDVHTLALLKKGLSQSWKVKYGNIKHLAYVASYLMPYHPDFKVWLVDSVLEQIRVGLETRAFKYNQQRLSQVKYLGELYNHSVIDSSVIFDTLYLFLSFGHEHGQPLPGVHCTLDPPDDFFRIRLVCTLLDTCGSFFSRGASRTKLDLFLVFFQFYICTKDNLPMEIEFTVQDTLGTLRPDLKIRLAIDEAYNNLSRELAKTFENGTFNGSRDSVIDDEESSDTEAEYDGNENEEDGEEEDDRNEDVDEDDGDEDEDDDDDDEEEDDTDSDEDSDDDESFSEDTGEENEVGLTRKRRDPVPDEEFDREFARMMTESLESRRFEKRTAFDVPLPMKRPSNQHTQHAQQASSSSTHLNPNDEDGPDSPISSTVPSGVKFRLLTKRGNRQHVRTVELPADSLFAVSTQLKREAEEEERRQIKNLVLNYERHAL